jgi:hypothetical protein
MKLSRRHQYTCRGVHHGVPMTNLFCTPFRFTRVMSTLDSPWRSQEAGGALQNDHSFAVRRSPGASDPKALDLMFLKSPAIPSWLSSRNTTEIRTASDDKPIPRPSAAIRWLHRFAGYLAKPATLHPWPRDCEWCIAGIQGAFEGTVLSGLTDRWLIRLSLVPFIMSTMEVGASCRMLMKQFRPYPTLICHCLQGLSVARQDGPSSSE